MDTGMFSTDTNSSTVYSTQVPLHSFSSRFPANFDRISPVVRGDEVDFEDHDDPSFFLSAGFGLPADLTLEALKIEERELPDRQGRQGVNGSAFETDNSLNLQWLVPGAGMMGFLFNIMTNDDRLGNMTQGGVAFHFGNSYAAGKIGIDGEHHVTSYPGVSDNAASYQLGPRVHVEVNPHLLGPDGIIATPEFVDLSMGVGWGGHHINNGTMDMVPRSVDGRQLILPSESEYPVGFGDSYFTLGGIADFKLNSVFQLSVGLFGRHERVTQQWKRPFSLTGFEYPFSTSEETLGLEEGTNAYDVDTISPLLALQWGWHEGTLHYNPDNPAKNWRLYLTGNFNANCTDCTHNPWEIAIKLVPQSTGVIAWLPDVEIYTGSPDPYYADYRETRVEVSFPNIVYDIARSITNDPPDIMNAIFRDFAEGRGTIRPRARFAFSLGGVRSDRKADGEFVENSSHSGFYGMLTFSVTGGTTRLGPGGVEFTPIDYPTSSAGSRVAARPAADTGRTPSLDPVIKKRSLANQLH